MLSRFNAVDESVMLADDMPNSFYLFLFFILFYFILFLIINVIVTDVDGICQYFYLGMGH